jgi:hypothetical protein
MIVLGAFMFTASCTTKTTPSIQTKLPQEVALDLKIGDMVKITTHNGEQYKFKVEMITNEGIEGEGHQIAFADMAEIKKVYITGRTVALVLGIIAILVALILISTNSSGVEVEERRTASSGN